MTDSQGKRRALVATVLVAVMLTSVVATSGVAGAASVASSAPGDAPGTIDATARDGGSTEAAGPTDLARVDDESTATGPAGASRNESTANGSEATPRDTAVVWRGFRHAWSYNHRFNRFGSWVEMRDCGRDLCDYQVGHAAASGSGEDKAAVRDAYTELSAANVGFYADDASFDLDGHEKKPDGSGRFVKTETVRVDVGSDVGDYDEYAVVLNGIDAKKTSGHSGKVIDFEVSVDQPKRNGDALVFTIRAEVLLDCDSFECKGPLPLKKLRGGKFVQEIHYDLDVDYLVVGGDARAFQATPTSAIENDYSWDNCLNNKVENPFTETQEDDNWGSNFFPGNHMNCERSTGRELHAKDFDRQTSIRSAGGGYSTGTVGVTSLSVNLEHETHFTQYDSIVGGGYDGTGYDVYALPFYKEWSSRPGQYKDARFAYGFKGSGTVGVTPILLEFRNACKRSFVNAGGIHWKGGGKDPTTSKATVTDTYRFAYGNQWKGNSGRGSACEYDVDPLDVPTSRSADPAFWVPSSGSLWNEFGGGRQDPTKLTGDPGDRYYSGEQENPPVDTADIRSLSVGKVVDDDGDGAVAKILYEMDADFRYDDPVEGPSEFGSPHVKIEYKRAGSGRWITENEYDTAGRDGVSYPVTAVDEYTDHVPDGKFTHVRVSVYEKLDDGSLGPRLDRAVVALPHPVEFERAANDRVVEVSIDSNPQGATVFLDGQRIGKTPIDGEIPGGERDVRKTLEFRKDGYQTRYLPVEFDDRGTNDVDTKLYRPDKPIVVRSSPNASVWIHGRYVGETPLVVKRPPSVTVDIEIRPDSDVLLNPTFEDVSAPDTINASLVPYTGPSGDVTVVPIGNVSVPDYPVFNGTNLTDGGNQSDGDDGGDGDDGDDGDGGNNSVVVDFPSIDGSDLTVIDPTIVPRIPNLTALTFANASVPNRTGVYTNATFDASNSYSLAGPIDSYRWDFGDGDTARGPVVDHAYDSGGNYTVALTVTANGTTATTTKRIRVVDRPPTARFSVVDPPVERGEVATFDASGSTDPESSISVRNWEMGDGVRWSGERINHTYTQTGNVTVTLTVTDAAGNQDTVNRTIRVREPNDPPRARMSVSTRTAAVGDPITFDAGGSADPDGNVARYTWRLDNGARATGSTLEFAFSNPGTHDVTLVVRDDDGATTKVTETVRVTRSTGSTTTTTTTTAGGSTTTATTDGSTTSSTATTPTGEGTTATTATTGGGTTTGGSTAATASTTTPPGGTTTDDDGPSLPTPGFGPLATLVALAIVALLAFRRRQ